MTDEFAIASFYRFQAMPDVPELVEIRDAIRLEMENAGLLGTVILASEGYNGSISGKKEAVGHFLSFAEGLFGVPLDCKISYDDGPPFKRIDVKIKPEIVTLKKRVDHSKGAGTHVSPKDWNRLISEPDVVVLDARNNYEVLSGTFRGAVNPQTEKFSELPEFILSKLADTKEKTIAMFCTGGIRCEKLTPHLKELGFTRVFQLNGGILRYLEEVPKEEQMWEGECFVFDRRTTLNSALRKGYSPDYSRPVTEQPVDDLGSAS